MEYGVDAGATADPGSSAGRNISEQEGATAILGRRNQAIQSMVVPNLERGYSRLRGK